jgi:hypothetical protein
MCGRGCELVELPLAGVAECAAPYGRESAADAANRLCGRAAPD